MDRGQVLSSGHQSLELGVMVFRPHLGATPLAVLIASVAGALIVPRRLTLLRSKPPQRRVTELTSSQHARASRRVRVRPSTLERAQAWTKTLSLTTPNVEHPTP